MRKRMTPEQRAEVVRILTDIRTDLAELRTIFERLHARLQAQSG
jgi:hypothetical protein